MNQLGNLDSKNSLEIMNIIKAISKEKLVLLVTHEVDLAKFYATRIIELEDGKVIKDYENETKDSLEYRLDNKIYLKDLKIKDNLSTNNINLNIYSDGEQPTDIQIVIKNGNIFIKSDNKRIETIDNNSAVELIDDHYKKIDKSIYEKHKYNLDEIIDKKYKLKYSSIYSIVKSIKHGFNRILNYTFLKKILLIGFMLSSMFIAYSVCNIAGSTDIRESDYINIDKNYLKVDLATVKVNDFLKYENLENVDYAMPGDSKVSFKIKMDNFYQLSNFSFELKGSLVDIAKINENSIVAGRMPENDYEIVIDKKVAKNLLNEEFSMIKGMGIKNEDELLNRIITIDGMKEFKIVGFVDNLSKSIYVKKDMFINILNNMTPSDFGMGVYMTGQSDDDRADAELKDYNLYLDDIKVTKGKLPEKDYEVIINKSNEEEVKLNKEIKTEVNGKKLKVVGFYESKINRQDYLVNNNTVKYSVITKNNGFTIYPKDKQALLDTLKNEYHLNIIDVYEKDKKDYIEDKKEAIKSSVIFAGVILAISLIEIYLMIRSSFLSRIKEIGVLRAIGVKKNDIYRMFVGEILSITTLTSLPGIALMTYILSQISKIPYVDRLFIINFATIGISIALVYIFNIIVGLLPLFKVIRKAPARILARHDVE